MIQRLALIAALAGAPIFTSQAVQGAQELSPLPAQACASQERLAQDLRDDRRSSPSIPGGLPGAKPPEAPRATRSLSPGTRGAVKAPKPKDKEKSGKGDTKSP
jgi:hypothetical protein